MSVNLFWGLVLYSYYLLNWLLIRQGVYLYWTTEPVWQGLVATAILLGPGRGLFRHLGAMFERRRPSWPGVSLLVVGGLYLLSWQRALLRVAPEPVYFALAAALVLLLLLLTERSPGSK